METQHDIPFTFLVIGCGYVGRVLAADLAGRGHQVIGVRRNLPDGADGTPEGFRWMLADVTCNQTMEGFARRLSQGPDRVERIDGVFYLPSAARGGAGAARAIYADGPERLLRVLRLEALVHSKTRWVFVSSTGVYGQVDGAWVDEASGTEPRIEAGKAMLLGESSFQRIPVESGCGRGVAVRLSGLYGPGRTRLVSAVERGDVIPGRAHRWLNQLHRDDAAGVLRHVGLAVPFGEMPRVLCASDMEPATRLEVLSWIARRTGAEPPRVDVEAAVPDPVRGNKRVDSRRLQALGYAFSYPTYREGYEAVLEGRERC